MSLNDVLYYIAFFVLATFTLVAAFLTVVVRNVVHAALALVGAFFGVAAIYLLLEAEFLAVVQILIYVGAISVLILFAIMLTRGLMQNTEPGTNTQWAAVAVVAVLLFLGMFLISARGPWPISTQAITTDLVPRLGELLVTTYVLPFEVVSVLLLGILVGSLMIARE